LVPRKTTRIILCDDDEGLAARAARVLHDAGYTDITCLAGGVSAWEAAGYVLFSGMHVPSKAFGEFIEHEAGTPSIAPQELAALRNGTMGWHLAGLACASGKADRFGKVSDAGLAAATAAAAEVARRFDIPRINRATLERFRADQSRTTYVFDVRDPSEYVQGH